MGRPQNSSASKKSSFWGNIFSKSAPKPTRQKQQGRVYDAKREQNRIHKTFEKRLKQIAEQQDLVIAGNLHVLNLAKVKEKIGERWGRLHDVIQLNIEAIIKRHMKKNDEFMRRSDLDYVIIFHNSDQQETNQRLALVSKEIVEKVFGTDALTEGFELETTAEKINKNTLEGQETLKEIFAQLDGSSNRNTYSRASFAKGAAIIEEQGAAFLAEANQTLTNVISALSEVASVPDLNDFISVLEQISPKLEDTKATCNKLLNHGASHYSGSDNTVKELEAVLATTNDYAKALKVLKEQALTKISTITDTGTPPKHGAPKASPQAKATPQVVVVDPDDYKDEASKKLDPLRGASFYYAPLWDVKREMISTFRCDLRPDTNTPNFSISKLFKGYSLEDAHLHLDMAVLRHIVRDLQSFAEEGAKCALTAAISFSSISAPKNRTKILQLVHALAERQRKLLVIEILNIDTNTWASRITEVVGFLKPHCRAVILRLPPRYRYLGELKQAGVFAVGLDVSELKLKEANIFEELDSLCALADQTKIKVFLSGVNSMSIASSAVSAGADYIDGDIIPSDHPVNLRRLSLADIYTSQLTPQ